jgi:hypothetical protein
MDQSCDRGSPCARAVGNQSDGRWAGGWRRRAGVTSVWSLIVTSPEGEIPTQALAGVEKHHHASARRSKPGRAISSREGGRMPPPLLSYPLAAAHGLHSFSGLFCFVYVTTPLGCPFRFGFVRCGLLPSARSSAVSSAARPARHRSKSRANLGRFARRTCDCVGLTPDIAPPCTFPASKGPPAALIQRIQQPSLPDETSTNHDQNVGPPPSLPPRPAHPGAAQRQHHHRHQGPRGAFALA